MSTPSTLTADLLSSLRAEYTANRASQYAQTGTYMDAAERLVAAVRWLERRLDAMSVGSDA